MKERDIQRLVLDWLTAKRIWHIRLNTGAMSGSYKGKKWFVKFGKPGMADVLAFGCFPWDDNGYKRYKLGVAWIEVKAPKGKMSEAQEQFRKEVTAQGMKYLLVRDLDDVVKALEG